LVSDDAVEQVCVVANWCEENLHIATKARNIRLIRFNFDQEILLHYIARCAYKRVKVFVCIPKARQKGVSTFWSCWFTALAVIHDHIGKTFRGTVIAHIEKSSRAIFSMTRRFEKMLPAKWQSPLSSRQQGMIEWDKTGSFLRVDAVGTGDGLGKGFTFSAIHFSEAADFADQGIDPDDTFEAAVQALEPGFGSYLILESTAKGRDPFFYRLIRESLENKNSIGVVFLPWYLTVEYSMTWEQYKRPRELKGMILPDKFEPTTEEVELREQIENLQVAPGQEFVVYPHYLTDEQLIWRRDTIEDRCNGKLHTFYKYYPSTLNEAFVTADKSMFSGESIDHYSAESKGPERRGDVKVGQSGRPEFHEHSQGYVQIWEDPIPGKSYVVGADCAAGLKGRDFSAAYVLCRDNLRVVASFHGSLDVDRYAEELWNIGMFYNKALVAPENNRDLTVALKLSRRGYPRLYYYRALDRKSAPTQPGWNTNTKTRKLLMSSIGKAIRDRSVQIYDSEFVREMSTFTWNARRKKYEAQTGKNDDRIMALAICLAISDYKPEGQPESPPGVPEGNGVWEAFQAEQKWLSRQKRNLQDRKPLVF